MDTKTWHPITDPKVMWRMIPRVARKIPATEFEAIKTTILKVKGKIVAL